MPEEYKQPAIQIENLAKNYGSKKVLKDICFTVNKGEIMGFLGPNGAGKSTTMNIICGYLASSGGRVLIDGINAEENPIEVKRRIGYLPEIPPLYTDMTVLEYLDFVYELKGVKANQKAHLRKVMEKVRIYDVKDRLIKNLSKGYKQRVGLAQALVGDPDVLILDEPTVGLDPRQIMEIREVISELGRERTVILSTHILQEVTAVCDSYTIINDGEIVATGDMTEFAGSESNLYKIRVMAEKKEAELVAKQVQDIDAVKFIGNVEEGTTDLLLKAQAGRDIRANIFTAFAKNSCILLSMTPASRSLEDVFMQAVSNIDAAAYKESDTKAEERGDSNESNL